MGHAAHGDAIEHAARIIDDILCRDPEVAREMFGDEPDRIARALAAAGLLRSIPAHRNGDGESIEEAYQRGHEDGYEKRLKEKP